MPAVEFARLLADESGRSVILAESLDQDLVTGEFVEMSVDDIARQVARRMGVSVRIAGEVIFLGTAAPEDLAQLVRRVRRLDPDAIKQTLLMFASPEGRHIVENDGLVVVLDRVEVLEQLALALEAVEREESAVWIVQLHLIGWSRRAAEEFGVDVAPAAAVAASLAFGPGRTTEISGSASLDAILRLANDRDDVAVVAAPMLVLLDGETASFIQGDRVPIPRRVVSDQGTVSTQGYDFIQTGTQISVKLRERSESSARVDLDVGMSDLRRIVEEAPVTGEETLKTSAVVEATGVYLLGSMSRERRTAGASIGWQTGDYVAVETQVIQVWLEAFRVAGPLSRTERMQAQPSPAVPDASAESEQWESVGPVEVKR